MVSVALPLTRGSGCPSRRHGAGGPKSTTSNGSDAPAAIEAKNGFAVDEAE